MRAVPPDPTLNVPLATTNRLAWPAPVRPLQRLLPAAFMFRVPPVMSSPILLPVDWPPTYTFRGSRIDNVLLTVRLPRTTM